LPALDLVLTSNQKVPVTCTALRNINANVLCSVICEFHYALGVQTDFTTQANFLPELLLSYLPKQKESQPVGALSSKEKSTEKSENEEEDQRKYVCTEWKVDPKIRFIDKVNENEEEDQRKYVCTEWKVDPKIRFIDKVKWDPPIFDHRRTIPKVVQRHFFDQCDLFASKALLCIVKIAKEASLKSDSSVDYLSETR
uniref:FSA_C domain-containing protein n=1 Tax=Gongylonema pulchrum TaxID=637853 RepID=A0A183DRQ7_9BILA